MKYEAVIDIVYPNGRIQTIKHRAPADWLARWICRVYLYGTQLMPLAGGAVVADAFVSEVRP